MGSDISLPQRGGGRLSAEEVKRVQRRFSRLARDGQLSTAELAKELGLAPPGERVIRAAGNQKEIFEADTCVAAIESIVRSRDPRQQMKLMFEVYDRDQDQFIGFDDLLSMLQVATTKRVAAGELERVCRALIEVFDADKDGRLSLGEFSNLVKASSELRAPS